MPGLLADPRAAAPAFGQALDPRMQGILQLLGRLPPKTQTPLGPVQGLLERRAASPGMIAPPPQGGLLQPAMGDVLQGPWGMADRAGRPHPTESSGGGGLIIRPKQFAPKAPVEKKPNINHQKQERSEIWGPKTPGWSQLSSDAKVFLYGKPVKGSTHEGTATSRTPKIESEGSSGNIAHFGGEARMWFGVDARGNPRVTDITAPQGQPVRGRQMLQWLRDKYGKPVTVHEVNPGTEGFWKKMQAEGLVGKLDPKPFTGDLSLRGNPSAKDTAQTSFPQKIGDYNVTSKSEADLIARGIGPLPPGVKPRLGTPTERNASKGGPTTLAERRKLTESLLGEGPQRSPIGPGSSAYESGIQGLRGKLAESVTSKQAGQAQRNLISAWASKSGIPTDKAASAYEQISSTFAAKGMSLSPEHAKYLITLAHQKGKL